MTLPGSTMSMPRAGKLTLFDRRGESHAARVQRELRSLLSVATIRHVLVGMAFVGALALACAVASVRIAGAPGVTSESLLAISLAVVCCIGAGAGHAILHAGSASPRLFTGLGLLLPLGSAVAASVALTAPSGRRGPVLVGVTACLVAISAVVIAASVRPFITEVGWRYAGPLLLTGAPVGGVAGVLVVLGAEDEFGAGGASCVLILLAVVAATHLRRARRSLESDLQDRCASALQRAEWRRRFELGQRPPLLECRGINFSYGQLQVLYDLNFRVDEGEMIALLGTNGAGKSTLLRVISGLGQPSSGSIQFLGGDLAGVPADKRVRLGIAQVPGGKAVFGSMTVEENLRALAFTLGRDREREATGIAETYEAFPRLFERRAQLAATLSGGEQQMLGLATAFILRPKLLLIDELSLGLAPVIVGQLLDMIRRINQQGTAVVLVEQSVNVALSLVDRAYFMEKGEIRFEGASRELLARPDLLRSVFLEGASKGLAAAGARPLRDATANGDT